MIKMNILNQEIHTLKYAIGFHHKYLNKFEDELKHDLTFAKKKRV